MSRKFILDSSKPSRNDRFAQMSRQEQVIEQKKKEIQARLQQQQKEKATTLSTSSTLKSNTSDTKKPVKPLWKGSPSNKSNQNANKTSFQFNMFSNDGSFLDQFKQMNDKKNFDQKTSSNKSEKSRENQDKSYSEERSKPSRWSKSRSNFSSDDCVVKNKVSRFSDPVPELQTTPVVSTYSTKYPSNNLFVNNFSIQPSVPVQTTGSMLQPPPQIMTSFPVTNSAPILVPPPLPIPGVPPPQITNNVGALIAPPPPQTNINQNLSINVPPPVISVPRAPLPCSIELSSIPTPNPIPVHTIPQPEPLNALNIPPPAPLQLQNIPPPSPIRLSDIPNPKPLDLLKIPAPGEDPKSITDPDFIKNIPPPNKSVPPPTLGTITELPNISIPPPLPSTAVIAQSTSVPPPLHPNNTVIQNIPPLMAQPVLPPAGINRPASSQNINVSQPIMNVLSSVNVAPIPGPPPVLNQPPPLAATNQIPPMNFPPPLGPPPSIHVNVNPPPPHGIDLNAGSAGHDAMVSLGRMVAQCGSGIEDIVQQRSAAAQDPDPALWFLFHKNSAAYQQYRQLVEQFRAELGNNSVLKNSSTSSISTIDNIKTEYQPEDIYEPENVTDDEQPYSIVENRNLLHDNEINKKEEESTEGLRKRKRKSRWGEKVIDPNFIQITSGTSKSTPLLCKITRNDQGLIQYAVNTFGSTNLTEEEWKKAEDHYKVNLLYQEMVQKREEIERLKKQGKNKYEYDSDEETDGGTWEHKLRMQEMEATQMWANELTRQAEGKHHIGDFLPPEELQKFMEKCSAAKEGRQPNLSDYKEFKLKEDNIGFKMLQKLGWQEGQGLGSDGSGIVEPVNKNAVRENQGLGLQQESAENSDDEYDAYRKRMMLAYRFRPNPLNNPRRPYY